MNKLLSKLKKLNISIDVINDKLDVVAPKDIMTDELLNEIKEHKEELIKFISAQKREGSVSYSPIDVQEVKENYDLSSAQHRLWILSEINEGNTAYNMPITFILEGDLDKNALKNVFTTLIERHEILRTNFVIGNNGKAKQVVLPFVDHKFLFSYEDLSKNQNNDETVKQSVLEEVNFEFDLSLDSLLRAKLLKVSEEKYIFNLVMHHIISDGWSIKILSNEIFTLYNAYIKGVRNSLAPLRIQYKDYAIWKKEQLLNGKLEEDKQFWLRQFDHEPPVLNLPELNNYNKEKTYKGKVIRTSYDTNQIALFNQLCKKEGATLYMGLLGLIKVLLFKYTSQKEIVIGSPVSGREHHELSNQIGFYVNLLGLKTVIEPNDNFRDFLVKLKKNVLEAYDHQNYPFDALLENLSLNRNSLFDIVLTLENKQDQSAKKQTISGLTIEEYDEIEKTGSKFGLEFVFKETENGLDLLLTYNTDRYSEKFVEKISCHLEVLIDHIVDNSTNPIGEIPFLSKEEEELIFSSFNDTKTQYPKEKTFVELFKEQVNKSPESIAIVDCKENLTYRDLDLISDKLAYSLLKEQKVKKGDLVGVKLGRSSSLIISLLGVLKCGGVYLPIDPNYPKDRIRYIEKDSNCRLVINEEFIEEFNQKEISVASIDVKIKPSDLAYVIYTSGSTGKPKGVMIEHKNLVNMCYWNVNYYKLNEQSKATLFSGTAFDASIFEICPCLLSGGTLYPISDDDIRIDISRLSSFLISNGITQCYLPTQICQSLVDNEFHANNLTIVTAGDVLKLNKVTGLNIYNNYGPTENTVVTSAYKLTKDINSNIPIGKPISNTQVYILNDSLNILPIGCTGKLFVGGDSVARGYLNRQELTKERFVKNPFVQGDRMYDTGDLASWLPDGNISFVGRVDEQVKIRGFRVELGEIEQVLSKQQGVKQAIVTLQDIAKEKQLVAYLLPEQKVEIQEIKDKIRQELPSYMIPSCFIIIRDIPVTTNGKIDKAKLPVPLESDFTADTQLIEAKSNLEIQLVNIWREILGVNSIGVNSVFFDLGGSSISAAKIINKIKVETGFNLSFKEIFQNPTIQEIIPFLKEDTQNSNIPIVEEQEYYPLTSSQLRFWILCQMPEVNKTYNIPFTVNLSGDLDIKLLNEAFNLLIQRHEILRTCFVQDSKGEIKQQIQTIDAIDFNLDLVALDTKDAISDTISEFNNQSFDLEKAPLIKACLIKADDSYYLSIIVHHIVFDGHSLQILMKDVSKLYNNLLSSSNGALPELKVQFKDYTAWVNNVASNNKTKQHEFWMRELSGELPILNIPTYQNRPQLQTFNGNSLSYPLNNELFRKLGSFSKKQKTTDFTVLLAALKGLLFRYTNQTDIIVGTPVLGRDHIDLENQIGLYINTIPVRTKFDISTNFDELVVNQKNTLVKAYANSGYSFGDILNGLSLQRDTSRSPVFDVLVIYQNQINDKKNFNTLFDGVHCESYNGAISTVSKYDITFSFLEFEGRLSLSIEYNTDLYEQSFIEDLMINFENFLEKCINTPSNEIQKIDYLNEEQTYKLLKEFNETQKVINFQKTVVDLFTEQAQDSPEKTAIVCESKEITYEELDKKSTQLAIHLQEKGVQPNTTVGVFLERSIDIVVAILGVLKSGASYLPLDPFYPIHRTDYILENSQTEFVIANSKTHKIVPDLLSIINLDDQTVWKEKTKGNLFKIEPSSVAYVIYTSGSTGKPKGVKVSHRNLSNFIAGMNHKFDDSKSFSDVWLAMTSMSFDISVLELLWPLTEGNKIIMHLERPVPIIAKPKMDFSLFYFPTHNNTNSKENKYQLLIEGAKFADNNGFEAIWVPERHFHNFGDQFPNPSVAAAAVSTITKNIRLRSGSVVLPLHDPIRVAEEWSMVDNLSEGRVELSIASGWHPNDFVLAPNRFENRHKIMREGITTLKNLWGGGSVTRKNGVDKDFELHVHPKPIQKELPLWITAAGNIETFKYAASIGANILTHLLGQSIEDLEEKIKVYRQTLLENGYQPENYKVALMLHTFVHKDVDFVKQTVEHPFKNYLKNSINLLKPIAEELGLDLGNDLEPLLDIGYQRFYKTSSLFGTPESCQKIVNRVYDIGVDEIACLIDFGVEQELVVDNLKYLFDLKDSVKRSKEQHDFILKTLDKLTEEESTSQLIYTHKVTHIQSTPSLFEELLLNDKDKEALQNVKTLLVGGEALKKSLAQKLIAQVGSHIHNMYGPTETTIWSSVKTIEKDEDINIGKPLANTQIYVLDRNNIPCPVRVSGELCIGGDGVTLGYLNKEELTNERFIDDPFRKDQKVYKTGDLACWLPNGELQYLGRLDSQVKINGYRIELKEIENIVLDYERIVQCAVTTIESNNQTFLLAYIRTTEVIDNNLLKEFLRLRLPHYMIPQDVITLEEFPQTPNGKIDFKALPKPNSTKINSKNHIAPRSETEKKLSTLWADFLKVEQISIDDNFFEIGGNSMKAFQLLSAMNAELNIDLKIISLFQYPTIRTLAENLENKEDVKKVQIEENEMEDVEDLIDFMSDI